MPISTRSLEWIDQEQNNMLSLLESFANINSGSENLSGLADMLEALKFSFGTLGADMREIDLAPRVLVDNNGTLVEIPHGKALSLIKRPDAPLKVFLGGHMDTVYPLSHPFQKTKRIDKDTLQGPGVADMKGGLIVMLKALETLEKHPLAKNIGWEVLINSDEEVGSIGSESLLIACAKRNSLGLVFEPSFPDGSLASSRKGTANLTVICKGLAAHSGRDHEKGRNAIAALAKFIVAAHALTDPEKGITVNIGKVTGGGPVNVVPDLAICRLNVRTVHPDDFIVVESELNKIANSTQSEGIQLTLHLQHIRMPKRFDKKSERLFNQLKECAKEQGIDLLSQPSGGACDGNILSANGLPVIDTLGVIGGHIHTPDEYMVINSLSERAKLVAGFLIKCATGEYS